MYASDKPVVEPQEDLLNRKSFATLLAKSLMSLNNEDTFTVGLFGKWGSGKTSLVNMTLHELELAQKDLPESEKTIVVRFEPWNFTDANQLVSQFFVRIINTFRSKTDKNLVRIGDAIEKYSEAFTLALFIPEVGSAVSSVGKFGAKTLGRAIKGGLDDKDALKQKGYAEKVLSSQKSRILIVIDDIDRLSNEQIRYVFQLVTAVAKLPNITYLLVFDKEIVTKALEAVQGGDGNDYLEKVIQMPISIPDLRKTDLHNVLFKKLDQLINDYPGIGFEKNHWEQIFQHCISPFISTLREVNRLCNVLEFKLSSIATEIDFADLCAITLVEAKFPKLYEWIKNNKSILTGEHDWDYEGSKKSQKERNAIYTELIRPLLNDGENVERIIKMVSVLFPYFGEKTGKGMANGDSRVSRKRNCIAHPSKFDRYFDLNLDFIGLKKSDIDYIVFHADESNALEMLLDIDKQGYGYELLDEIMSFVDTLPAERAAILVKALFSGAESLSETGGGWLSSGARNYAKYVILDILQRVPENQRYNLLVDILSESNGSMLAAFSLVLNTIELGYGRLAANGKEREFHKTVTLEELEQLEIKYSERAKEVLSTNCLLDIENWGMILYMLECFCPEYITEYMQKLLEVDTTVLKYLAGSVTEWIGNGKSFELSGDYEKYISKERALGVINAAKESGVIFTLSETIQQRVAAYYIAANREDGNSIASPRIDSLLAEWKKEFH